jgi:hypothetical protein
VRYDLASLRIFVAVAELESLARTPLEHLRQSAVENGSGNSAQVP